jgi:hypothetical protein
MTSLPRHTALDIARLALALDDTRPGHASMAWAVQEARQPAGLAPLVQALVDSGRLGADPAEVAATLVRQVGLSGAIAAEAQSQVAEQLSSAGRGHEAEVLLGLVHAFASAEDHPVPELAAAARAFNREAAASLAYASLAGTVDLAAAVSRSDGGVVFTDQGGGAVRLTGDRDVRIDVTNQRSVVVGIDRDGDGVIELDGSERGAGSGAWHIVDAYPRNPLDHTDSVNNFTGDLYFDGEGLRGAAPRGPAMLVFGHESGADRVQLGAGLRTTLDDRGIDGRLHWQVLHEAAPGAGPVDLSRAEAVWLAPGAVQIGVEDLGQRTAVAAALAGIGWRQAAGADALVLLPAADAPSVSALYLFRDADRNGVAGAAELTLLGIVSTTGDALAPADITLA